MNETGKENTDWKRIKDALMIVLFPILAGVCVWLILDKLGVIRDDTRSVNQKIDHLNEKIFNQEPRIKSLEDWREDVRKKNE